MKKWLAACLLLLSVAVLARGQKSLTGNNYVEKQLLCALDKAPCDGLGKQIKDSKTSGLWPMHTLTPELYEMANTRKQKYSQFVKGRTLSNRQYK
ncbi:hypothetical protein NQ318_003940 [Aromia moschata]|uniref:Secreted protein n=1 Tax=Aromia moschata TaxID=1265417 RepID=A0AAV8Z9T6_9CUCU|nr:hypothetical protein NQ318_003940 [Aromia moschata]